jgi:protein TonB
MMRSWLYKNAKTVVATSVAISVVTHVAVITGWVVGTLPDPGLPSTSIANRVFYIPPPDRTPGQAGQHERVHYIKTDLNGLGTGEGARQMGNERPTSTDETIGHEIPAAKDSVSADSLPEIESKDSVYSILEVDTAVVRSATSAAPAYPPTLLAAHIQGFVNAQYVVDTTGRADTATFVVMESTNPEFVAAVKDVLPFMRFQPAKIGPIKVRQLVQQQFSFKITGDSLPVVPAKKKPQ